MCIDYFRAVDCMLNVYCDKYGGFSLEREMRSFYTFFKLNFFVTIF